MPRGTSRRSSGRRGLQFSPDDPHFAYSALRSVEMALRKRHRKKYPDRPLPPIERNHEFFYNIGEFTIHSERSCFLTIRAHVYEAEGDLANAREHYEDACRQNVYGDHEQRDLQRFLKKHNLPQWRGGPLLSPKNCDHLRLLKLPDSAPNEESLVLEALAAKFEREGKMLLAQKALLDRYMFDPSDAELYQRVRRLQKHAQFQLELKEDLKRRGQTSRPAPNWKF